MNDSIRKALRAVAILTLAIASSSLTMATAIAPGIYPQAFV